MKNYMGTDGFVWFQGVVEDRADPLQLGRVRVRCLGWHPESKQDVPTEDLPWAHILLPTNHSQDTVGLRTGDWVFGFFRDSMVAQEPMIVGVIPHIPEEVANTSKGFNDPTGTYPEEDKLLEPRTNRLARNENISQTIVQTKNDSRTTNVETATGSQWSEPASAYNAVYPKNRVNETESGHVLEIDDTPDAERIHEYHKAGTFYEVDEDGNKVTRVVGNNYTIIAGNDYVNVKGAVNLTIDGNCETYIKGDWNIKVDGSVNETIGGSQTTTITGNLDINANRIDLN